MTGRGHRGKIGFISPAGDTGGASEYFEVFPEGITIIFTTCAVSRLVPEDIEKAFRMYPAAAEHLAAQECDVIYAPGSLVFTYIGYDRAQKMIQEIRDKIGVPVITDLEAHLGALNTLAAKKIVIATPYTEARTEERKKLCESAGFEVLSTKSLGLVSRVEIQELPPYVSYKLAKQAFLEAPNADAIYISCPEWPTIENVGKLEQDTGKPVVYPVGAEVRALLQAMHIKEPIKGYGSLLEQM